MLCTQRKRDTIAGNICQFRKSFHIDCLVLLVCVCVFSAEHYTELVGAIVNECPAAQQKKANIHVFAIRSNCERTAACSKTCDRVDTKKERNFEISAVFAD